MKIRKIVHLILFFPVVVGTLGILTGALFDSASLVEGLFIGGYGLATLYLAVGGMKWYIADKEVRKQEKTKVRIVGNRYTIS